MIALVAERKGRRRRRRHGDHARPPAPRGGGRARSARPAPASASSPTATSRRRCSRSSERRRRRPAVGDRRHARGRALGRGDQVHRRPAPRPAVAARRRRAPGRDRRRLRPRRGARRRRLVAGDDVFFAATGVTDGDLLQGVRYRGDGHATTESLVMRSRSGTVRTVQRPPRPREAARGHRRPLRVAPAVTRSAQVAGRRRDRLHRRPARPRAARGRTSTCAAWSREPGEGRRPRADRRARSSAATCWSRRRSAPALDGDRASPTTSSTRWAAAPARRLRRPRRARRAATSPPPRRAGGVERLVYLGGLGEPGSEHLRSRHETAEILERVGRAAHLLPRRGRDRRRQRVVPDRLLPRQAPAGDGHARAGSRPGRSRSRSPTWSPTCAPRLDVEAAAGREIEIGGPEVDHLRRDDGGDGAGARPPPAAPDPGAAADAAALVAVDRPRDAGRRRRRAAADRGPGDRDGRRRPAPGWSCSRSSRRRSTQAMRAARLPSTATRPSPAARRRWLGEGPGALLLDACRCRGARSAAR